MIRYGILGFGLHGVRRLMPGFAKAQHCTVTGIWRRDQRKAQEIIREFSQYPIKAYETPEALCSAPDVDAIFVASPDALHLPHVLLAIQYRKPVLCEKPMAMNAAECEQMIAAADKHGVPLGVAHIFRFHRSVNRMREIIAANTIGKPLLARSEFHYLARHSQRAWLTDANLACGGPVGDVGVHCIDTLRYILRDEVGTVYARALRDQQSGSVESAAILLLEFKKGTIATVTVSIRAEYRTPLWITGDSGVVGADNALTVDHPIDLQTKTIDGQLAQERISNEDAYARQVDAFAVSLEQQIPFPAPGIEGLRNQQALDAAYESIRTGRPETMQK